MSCQQSEEFKAAVAALHGVVCFLPQNATDIAQPVDAGYAQILKVLVRQAFDRWMDNDDNADKWCSPDKTFTAKDRRILICNWAGEAYETLLGPEYDNLRRRCFEKTVCLMMADGSEDDLITPEGLGGASLKKK